MRRLGILEDLGVNVAGEKLHGAPVSQVVKAEAASTYALMAWDILSHPDCDTCHMTAGHLTP
jgi:hypothetical protein